MGEDDKTDWFRVAEPQVFSVSDLTRYVREILESSIGAVRVEGEVCNHRRQSSGHQYFTLKDDKCQISCVLFHRPALRLRQIQVEDGMQVQVRGNLTVYEARGQYQIIVRAVELQGVGALQAAFEKLKQKLAAEGLFAPERKRPLPEYPQRIGLITSPTGAAIRDVLHVVQRRNPALEIILAPCRVQGEGAAAEIAAAIGLLNEYGTRNTERGIDLILLTRGGGSLEDLWAFNEEVVARAIAASALPVVSAVGHEIDFTISDFVADFRAATPSAAAEIITQNVFASREFVAGAPARLARAARRGLESAAENGAQLGGRLARLHPRRRLDESLQRLDDLQSGLLRCLKSGVRSSRLSFDNVAGRFLRAKPSQILKARREALRQAEARLRLLGPEQVLARGYSITTDAATGKVLRDARQVKPGQRLQTRLKTGQVHSIVEP